MRRLIVSADDFGFTPDVNEGIIEAYQNGILKAAGLMANGESFSQAVALAKQNPGLDVGCHLVLVGGRSIAGGGAPLPRTPAALALALAVQKIRIYDELMAQVQCIRAAGIEPTHLDTHKHTHLLPSVLEAVAKISSETGIRWVRKPFDFKRTNRPEGLPWQTHAVAQAMKLVQPRVDRVLAQYGCKCTDHFTGFELTGRLTKTELAALIYDLPEGTTELMCHPGRCGDALRSAPTRLKESRIKELEALTAPETLAAIRKAGVEIAGFRDF